MHPRLQIVVPRNLVAVQFGDAVTVCAQSMSYCTERSVNSQRLAENEFMDRLELKSSTDRTLGIGVIEDEKSFLVLTAAVMMKTTVEMEEVVRFHPESVAILSEFVGPRLNSKQNWTSKTHQVDYDQSNSLWVIAGCESPYGTKRKPSDDSQNPLHFSFPPEIDEEALMSGAEQLSEAVLESGKYHL